jgi:hypothetical protein
MAYMNYAYTHFDEPGRLAELGELVAASTPIAPGGPNRRVAALREVAGRSAPAGEPGPGPR